MQLYDEYINLKNLSDEDFSLILAISVYKHHGIKEVCEIKRKFSKNSISKIDKSLLFWHFKNLLPSIKEISEICTELNFTVTEKVTVQS